jgi:putative transposase
MSKQCIRFPYPSDLSDNKWEVIKPYIPNLGSNRDRKLIHSYREILNAIFYLLRSGCSWRMLPHEFPPWKTVYHYFRFWRLNGLSKRKMATFINNRSHRKVYAKSRT